MAPSDNQTYDDWLLTWYLLGTLGDEETERLDELSIADDEFAFVCRCSKTILSMLYVRGELYGEILEQFRSFYLSSSWRGEKVQFAEALFRATALRSGENKTPLSQRVTARANAFQYETVH